VKSALFTTAFLPALVTVSLAADDASPYQSMLPVTEVLSRGLYSSL